MHRRQEAHYLKRCRYSQTISDFKSLGATSNRAMVGEILWSKVGHHIRRQRFIAKFSIGWRLYRQMERFRAVKQQLSRGRFWPCELVIDWNCHLSSIVLLLLTFVNSGKLKFVDLWLIYSCFNAKASQRMVMVTLPPFDAQTYQQVSDCFRIL